MKIWIVVAVLLFPSIAVGKEMNGVGEYVKDGDTFDLVVASEKESIRICGIDAPEGGQPGSREAWAKLSEMVHRKHVTCIQVGSKPRGTVCDGKSQPTNQGRVVAQCFVGNVDIAEEMVRSGHACSWAKYDGGHYARFGKACPPGHRERKG